MGGIYDICALFYRKSAHKKQEISFLLPDPLSFREEIGEDKWGNKWFVFNEKKYFKKVCEIYALFFRKSAYYKQLESIFYDVLAEYAPYNIDGEFSETDYKPYEGLVVLDRRVKELFLTLLNTNFVPFLK